MAKSSYGTLEHRRYERVRGRLVDLYGKHRVYKSHHDRLTADLAEFWQSPEVKRLSQLRRAMLSEVSRCLSAEIWRYDVVWHLGNINGPVPEGMSANHDWSNGVLGDLSRNNQIYGGHFWKDSDRPFTTWHSLSSEPHTVSA